jgi:hypothetical protein
MLQQIDLKKYWPIVCAVGFIKYAVFEGTTFSKGSRYLNEYLL